MLKISPENLKLFEKHCIIASFIIFTSRLQFFVFEVSYFVIALTSVIKLMTFGNYCESTSIRFQPSSGDNLPNYRNIICILYSIQKNIRFLYSAKYIYEL